MAVKRAYRLEGARGVQMLLPFPMSREAIIGVAKRMGVKSDLSPKRMAAVKEKRKPAHKEDPLNSLLRSWFPQCMTEGGPLAWRV